METGDTGPLLDQSDVIAVFEVETDPVYAEQTVEISSSQLQDRCGAAWDIESVTEGTIGGGGEASAGVGSVLDAGFPATATAHPRRRRQRRLHLLRGLVRGGDLGGGGRRGGGDPHDLHDELHRPRPAAHDLTFTSVAAEEPPALITGGDGKVNGAGISGAVPCGGG